MKLLLKIMFAIQFFRHGKIFFGLDPLRVSAPALVLFPLGRNTFCCGLAGILAVSRQRQSVNGDISEETSKIFREICDRDSNALLEGRHQIEAYLAGDAGLARLDNAISRLKCDESGETIFFSPEISARIAALCCEMNELIVREEIFLEQRAGDFSSALLEVITRRLIKLKDAAWVLEKDILNNDRLILALTGQADKAAIPRNSFRKYRQINFLMNTLDRLEVRGRDSAGLEVSFIISKAHF